jgi:3-oxoacyl-[acyl-carrier-protein] synthase-3
MVFAKITGLGHFLPEHRLTNHQLESLVDTNDEWIRTRTGIQERRIMRDKPTSYMCTEAAKEALSHANVAAEDIEAIVVATITPDYFFPSTACIVQKELGATNAYAFDISAACSGFLYALSVGNGLIQSGRHKKVLIIGGDKMSSILNYEDRNTCILFGDGAAAVVLEASEEETGIIDYVLKTEGDTNHNLIVPAGGSAKPASHETIDNKEHYLYQEGRMVFKKATESMADITVEVMQRNNLNADDVAWLVPHQANKRIIEATARRAGVSMEKVMLNIQHYGNTTAATIPLCLYDWKDKLNKGDNIILSAFGGGFTWGAMYLKWSI